MAIYAPPPPPFDCVICSKPQMRDFWDNYRGAHSPIPPLCKTCESGGMISRGYYYGPRFKHETNPDKRLLNQLRALSDQLQHEAAHGRT
jgi:hypothetical protein